MAPTTNTSTDHDDPVLPIDGRVHVSWSSARRRPSSTAAHFAEVSVTDVDTGEALTAITALTVRCANDEHNGVARVEVTEALDTDGRPMRADSQYSGQMGTRTFLLVPGEPEPAPDMHAATFGLDFGRALAALRAGRRVSRAGWNGAGQWLLLVPGSVIRVEADRPLGKAAPHLVGSDVPYHPHIDIKTADGTVVPWIASQTDLLAYDWQILDAPAGAR